MKKILSILMILPLFAGVLITGLRPQQASGASSDVCPHEPFDSNWYKFDGTAPTYSAPSGYTIDQVCVKGGQNKIFYSSNGSDGCWNVYGIGTGSGGANKVGSGSSCKDISHASFHITQTQTEEEPTPTPTPTDTPTPTPTPKDECTDCGGNNEEPTPTPTNTITPTPGQNTNVGGDGLSDGKSDGVTQKQGEVLGISTLPATGNFASTVATIEEVVGAALIAAGTLLNGKKKKTSKRNK